MTILGAPAVGFMATNEGRFALKYLNVKLPIHVELRPQPDDKSATKARMVLDGSEELKEPIEGAKNETVVIVKSDITSEDLTATEKPLSRYTKKFDVFADAMKFRKETVTR